MFRINGERTSTGAGCNPRAGWSEPRQPYRIALGARATASGGVGGFAAGTDDVASCIDSVALGSGASIDNRQGRFVFEDASTTDILRAGVHRSTRWRSAEGVRIYTSDHLTTGVSIRSGVGVSPRGSRAR